MLKDYNKLLQINQVNQLLQQTPIAIIGMASLFAQSSNLTEYWENILNEVDCITDVPRSHWNPDDYYDANPKTPDKTYCKRGGFIPEIDFNSVEFGLPPNILEKTDTCQLLSLIVAKKALEDAGYGQLRTFDRDRVGVILGSALGTKLGQPLNSRLQYPIWEKVLKNYGLSDQDIEKITDKIKSAYLDWDENAFPGLLSNVISGRIANRLDLGGINCTIDAACASSLAAVNMAINELVTGSCNMMLTGGVDTDNSIFVYLGFSKTPALSKQQECRPFDIAADGMMLGEGIGIIVLKRLADAQRDRDRIYAVIKGIGASSDGKYKSIYAPRLEGQMKALTRAYNTAQILPETIGLIEAHGTGTEVGDPVEFAALKLFFSQNNNSKQHIALGSVKSQIGHTKAAAGIASMIKATLALHHKILPATINVSKPHPKLEIEDSPFYLNTQTRPWIQPEGKKARITGISSFGFGGTNYHIVLEEYQQEHSQAYRLHRTPQIILLYADNPEQLVKRCKETLQQLQTKTGDRYFAELITSSKTLQIPITSARLGFVAISAAEAGDRLETIIKIFQKNSTESWQHPQGIYYRQSGLDLTGKVVALFPGQGSQYINMGRELAINFPPLRQAYNYLNSILIEDGLQPVSNLVFPPPVFEENQKDNQSKKLQQTEYAQPAIAGFSVGLYNLLCQAGFKPDFVAGHSFGELTALWAAKVINNQDYFYLVKTRGKAMSAPNIPGFDSGAMLAVNIDINQLENIIVNFPKVLIANLNSPRQVVLAGPKTEIIKIQQFLKNQGFSTHLLPVSSAFHTPLIDHARKPFAAAVDKVKFNPAQIAIYSNVTGDRYPQNPQEIQELLKAHLSYPVFFKHQIENIYNAGGYCFIEIGPRNILTNLVKEILGDRPHLAIALNSSRQKDSDRQLREAIVHLRVAGISLQNIDPYQLPQQLPEVENQKTFTVRLNAANLSEKKRIAFEENLQNNLQNEQKNQPSLPTEITAPSPGAIVTQASLVNLESLATHISDNSHLLPTTNMTDINYQKALESLEANIAQFNQHQTEALQTHRQYLNNEMEYAKIFLHILQQQNYLLNNSANQPTEIITAVMASLERSMMRLHDHQKETLRLHEQFLNHHTNQNQTFFNKIQQYYHLLTNDNTIYSSSELVTNNPTSEIRNEIRPEVILPAISNEIRPEVTETISPRPEVLRSELLRSQPPKLEEVISNNIPNTVTNIISDAVLPEVKTPEIIANNAVIPTLSQPTALVNNNPISRENKAIIPTVTNTSPAIISFDVEYFAQTLLKVVSEKTGYPVELLEMDMDMEADLGIDSIKRLEILSAMQDNFPDLPKMEIANLGEIRTLNQIVEQIKQGIVILESEKKTFRNSPEIS